MKMIIFYTCTRKVWLLAVSSRTQVFLRPWFPWRSSRTAWGPENQTWAIKGKETLHTKRTGLPHRQRWKDVRTTTAATAPTRSQRRSSITSTTVMGSWGPGHTPMPFCCTPKHSWSRPPSPIHNMWRKSLCSPVLTATVLLPIDCTG